MLGFEFKYEEPFPEHFSYVGTMNNLGQAVGKWCQPIICTQVTNIATPIEVWMNELRNSGWSRWLWSLSGEFELIYLCFRKYMIEKLFPALLPSSTFEGCCL